MRRKLFVIGCSMGVLLALAGCNINASTGEVERMQKDLQDSEEADSDLLQFGDGSVGTYDSNIISEDSEMIYEIYTVMNDDESDTSVSEQYVYCDIPYAFTLDEEWCEAKFGSEITEVIKNTERAGSRTVLYFKNGTEITEEEYDSAVNDLAI